MQKQERRSALFVYIDNWFKSRYFAEVSAKCFYPKGVAHAGIVLSKGVHVRQRGYCCALCSNSGTVSCKYVSGRIEHEHSVGDTELTGDTTAGFFIQGDTIYE